MMFSLLCNRLIGLANWHCLHRTAGMLSTLHNGSFCDYICLWCKKGVIKNEYLSNASICELWELWQKIRIAPLFPSALLCDAVLSILLLKIQTHTHTKPYTQQLKWCLSRLLCVDARKLNDNQNGWEKGELGNPKTKSINNHL
jgi:hypothetical protein